jgi:hypothetical protein
MKITIEIDVYPHNSKLESWEVQSQILENTGHVTNALELGLAACGVPASVSLLWRSYGELQDEATPSITFDK